jgi:hypothetical protein
MVREMGGNHCEDPPSPIMCVCVCVFGGGGLRVLEEVWREGENFFVLYFF